MEVEVVKYLNRGITVTCLRLIFSVRLKVGEALGANGSIERLNEAEEVWRDG